MSEDGVENDQNMKRKRKKPFEMGKNRTIPSGERSMILRVLHFFEEEKQNGPVIPLDQALKRTSAATGVSLSTITRIKREEKKNINNIMYSVNEILQRKSSSATPTSSSEPATSSLALTASSEVKLTCPGKKRRRPPHNEIDIDDFTICILKNIINSFYVTQQMPTLKKILFIAKTVLKFPGDEETLRKILTEKLGYTFKKCSEKINISIKRPEIVTWRARYFRQLKENKELGLDD